MLKIEFCEAIKYLLIAIPMHIARKLISRKVPIVLLIALVTLSPLCYISFKVVDRNAHYWLPGHIKSLIDGTNNRYFVDQTEHVMFVIVDHHEHPYGEGALSSATDWLRRFKKNVSGITDDYGNPFKYTWFHPYDNKRSPEVLLELNKLVFGGLGEIEFHWHHRIHSSDLFQNQLEKAVKWFNSYGAMVPIGVDARPAFAYVAGNWALDNALCKGSCGVSRELDALKFAGCYADFTFSSCTPAQPNKFSSIYYAVDDDRPKSYASGTDVQVGVKPHGLMIFQGPTAIDFCNFHLEHGAVEVWRGSNWKDRVKLWVEHAPFVKGKPDWRFVKVYTHGVQSKQLILGDKFRSMIRHLQEYCHDRDFRLHFVTSREAYNIVRAAENGLDGDPEEYRDYDIPPPINTVMSVPQQIESVSVSENAIIFQHVQSMTGNYAFRYGPVIRLEGVVSDYCFLKQGGSNVVAVAGLGSILVEAKQRIDFVNTVLDMKQENNRFVYTLDALPKINLTSFPDKKGLGSHLNY